MLRIKKAILPVRCMLRIKKAILPVRCMLRIKKAILPVSAARPSGAVVGGKKVHVQDQEAHTRESKRQTLKPTKGSQDSVSHAEFWSSAVFTQNARIKAGDT
jgi:hypothetical protein